MGPQITATSVACCRTLLSISLGVRVCFAVCLLHGAANTPSHTVKWRAEEHDKITADSHFEQKRSAHNLESIN